MHTIDCHYAGLERVAASYLLIEGGEAAFIETNTTHALPHLLDALRAHDLSPEQVRYVIITHVHLDHAGGASALMRACPNATLLAHPRAAPHAIDPSRLVHSARAVYGEQMFGRLYGEIGPIDADRVRIMDDGEVLDWGARSLRFLHTRGHANHHMVVVDSGTRTVFTGDAFGIAYPALQGDGLWVFPSSSPTDFDADAAIDSVKRIAALDVDRACLTHFGSVEALDDAADQLIAVLQDYGAWVRDADDSGLDGADLDAHLRTRVEARFEADRARYGAGADVVQGLLGVDVDLNAQGLAHAVRKTRYKRSRS